MEPTKEQALQALEEAIPAHLRANRHGEGFLGERYDILREYIADGVGVVPERGNTTCNPHPDAPHGFNRNASHNAGRYVCDCEGWMPPAAGVNVGQKPMSETGWPYNEKVQCAKRIMEAVDTYHERPDAMNRTALRGVILTELDEYASGVKGLREALHLITSTTKDPAAREEAERALGVKGSDA